MSTGQTSDGFHTFDELYHHRTILFALLADQLRKDARCWAWKARRHADGSMPLGYFIAGVKTPHGDATYHCRDEYWSLFCLPELDYAPAYDGHTPGDTLIRLASTVGIESLPLMPRT